MFHLAARLRHVSGTKWGTYKYMNMQLLNEMDQEAAYSVSPEINYWDQSQDKKYVQKPPRPWGPDDLEIFMLQTRHIFK